MEERTNVSRDKDQAVESPSIFPSSDTGSDSRRLSVKVVRQTRSNGKPYLDHIFTMSNGKAVEAWYKI